MGVKESVKFYIPTFRLDFNHWARTITLSASQILVSTGILSLFYGFPIRFAIGIYAIILGVILFAFTYPLPYLRKGGQLFIFQKYVIVGPVLMLASLPCFISLPTVLGGVPLLFGGLFYVYGAVRNEKSLTKEQIMKGGQI